MKEEEAKSAGSHELVMYVERGDHTFGPLQTGSYLAENYLDDLLDKQKRWGETCLGRLRAGEVTPIGYYMDLLGMTEADLACRAKVSRWRLRRHLTPAGFARADLPLLSRYAGVFGVPVARLFDVVAPVAPGVEIREEATPDRHVVITHISVKGS